MQRWLRPSLVALAALSLAACNLLIGGVTGTGIFVVDSGNNRLVRVSDMACNDWQTYSPSSPSFSSPYGLSVDSNGGLNVSDRGANDRVVHVDDISGVGFKSFGASGSGSNQFSDPAGLRVDNAGQVFVADPGNNRVVAFTGFPGTSWVNYAPTGGAALSAPNDVAWDSNTGTSDRKIYILDTGHHQIVRIDSLATGANRVTFGAFGSGAGQFDTPLGLYLQSGKIYVADTGNNRVVSFNTSEFSTPTPPSWQETSIALTGPNGIFVRSDASQIFIADTGMHRIVRLDLPLPGTNFVTCGSLGTGVGQFTSPTDIVAK